MKILWFVAQLLAIIKKAFMSYSYSFFLVEAILKENLHLQLKLQVAK